MILGLDEIAAMEFDCRCGHGGLGAHVNPPPPPVAMSSGQLISGSRDRMDFSSFRPSLPSQASSASEASHGPAGMTFSAKGVGLPSLSYGAVPSDWRGAARQASGFGGTGPPGSGSQYKPGGQSMLAPLSSGGAPHGPAGMTFSAKGVGLPSLSYGTTPSDWRGAARQASGFGGTGLPGSGGQHKPGGQSMLAPLSSGGFGSDGKSQMEPTRGVYPAMSAGAPMTTPIFTGSKPILVGGGTFAGGGPIVFGKGMLAGGGPMMLGLCSPEEIGAMEFGRR